MSGIIHIIIADSVPESVVERMEVLSGILAERSVKCAVERLRPDEGVDILIRVTEVGDISDKDVKDLLEAVFRKSRDVKGLTVALEDNEKRFQLPAEMGECIDWFVIE
jgi:hypothetical protein